MRIENDVKLDFSDVLIRPKRSTLTSRKNVELERSFTFIHSGRSWTGIPVAAGVIVGEALVGVGFAIYMIAGAV